MDLIRLLLPLLIYVGLSHVQARSSATQPLPTPEDCICHRTEPVCSCTFVVRYRLTMINEQQKRLIKAGDGELRFVDNNRTLTKDERDQVITADGVDSRLVIAINGVFPGPRIEVYENQVLNLTVVNRLHTDSITLHFHGIPQRDTPWMDGVAFITQCPINPGQTFVYRFTAQPAGTHFYHAHIGNQRSMGLYGPLIVKPDINEMQDNEIVITLQDWNHRMDTDTAYHRMLTGQFDFSSTGTDWGKPIKTTYSIDQTMFSRFEFQSGLVNGKGRYYNTATSHNGAPLERFQVHAATIYRLRIIGAMTLYPMRVYIRGHRMTLRSSDGYTTDALSNVQSVIVHPGERYDLSWATPGEPDAKEYFFVAETIETTESLGNARYHAAEAIFEMTTDSITGNPTNDMTEKCTKTNPCVTFNCPYAYYPTEQNRICKNFNDVHNSEPAREIPPTLEGIVDEEHFFNFGFPGPRGSPGSVNGRSFISPTGSLLTQPSETGETPCDERACTENGICDCTYTQEIGANRLVQMVFLNLGSGIGWSHPVHLHGHSFYVMKVGLGTYSQATGELERDSNHIRCTDVFGYCSSAEWVDKSWSNGRLPGLNQRPPEKDTVVVPNGGYVVVRFVSDNPGRWLLHCHIDLHSTNGMAMVIAEAGTIPETPVGFPVCNDFWYSGSGGYVCPQHSDEGLVAAKYKTSTIVLAVFFSLAVLILFGTCIFFACRK